MRAMNSKEPKISYTQAGVTGQEEDEMERELAEDAPWKRIQQNTFTRWANEHLKPVNKNIGNLEIDLSDGLRLIALVEVLSGKKLPRYNKRPNFRSQKLENVSLSLMFLQNNEGIKIVNIDSSDIVDCKLKLILGLIWTLILHYSISMPMWEGEDADVLREKGEPTPKQRLLGWVQSKLVDLPIQNFTSDWKDGIAVGALVDTVAPGLCPDWPDWSSKNALNNASEAMNLADMWLGVPQLITPEEMINPNIDELSMMTYLSQYPNAKLKPGAPLRPRTNPNRIRCYGPGVEPTGVVCGAPTNFTVETFGAGKGDIQVFVENPSGQLEPVEIKFNEDHSMTYTVTYTAKLEGLHKVKVTFANKEVPKSPFLVTMEGYAGDSKKVTVSGPGLKPSGVMIGQPTYFDVFTKDAGHGQVEVTIIDSHGNKSTISSRLRKINEDVYRCEYVSQVTGSICVNIFFDGQLIPNSPFGVTVSSVCDARKVRVSGRGLQPRGIRVRDIADFKVFTENAGDGNLEVKLTGSDGGNEHVEVEKIDDTTYKCFYRPMKEGSFVITVSYGGQEVPHSPFEVNVGPYKESKIRAYGPGLIGGVEGYPACFTVDTNGEAGSLGFFIEGPYQTKIKCDDNGDGSTDVKYFPSVPGDYAVHILCNNEDVPKSPFVAVILPKTDYFPEKVEAYGPGIDKNGVVQKRPVEFTVDTRRAGGRAPLCVKVVDENYKPVDLNVQDNKDGTYHCNYCPTENNKHMVEITFGGVAIPGSPYRVTVSEPTDSSKVQVFGPGIESGVVAETPTHFNVDAIGCGKGNLQVEISDDRNNLLPHRDHDNGDNTFTVDYTPVKPGNYKIKVLFAEKEVPSSPFDVNVHPKVDVSNIKVDGLEPSAFVDSPVELFVDTQAISKDGDAVIRCAITTPSEACTQALVQNLVDGIYKISYTPIEEGCHVVDILYNGVSVPGCPYKTSVTKGCDSKKCHAFGPGLKKGVVNEVNVFTVETKQAGTGSLSMAIEGPSEATMTCQDNRDGSCTVEYTPTEPGDYDISVKFANQFIPGSPFKVPVDYDLDASKVHAYGAGLDPEHCRAGLPLQFTVDAKKSAKAPLGVEVQSEYGPVQKKPEIKDKGDGMYDVMYFPSPEHSQCNLIVTYGGQDIAGSPFQMVVKPTYEPEKVKIYGPGVSPNGIPASLPAEFTIDVTEAGFAEPEVYLKGPDGKPRKSKLSSNNDGTYTVSYVPDDLGQYRISICYGGQEVSNSPFLINSYPVGQAEKCQLTEGKLERIFIGEEHCITINTEHAGNGAITCRILSISEIRRDVDVEVENNGDGTFSVYYTLKETGQYTICILFGGQPIPGGVYTVTVVSEEIQERKFVDSVDSIPRSQFLPIEFNTIPVPACEDLLTAEVIMPSGKFDKPVVIDNHDGTISLKYDPKEEGSHELQIKYNKDHVPGSPFKFYVDTVSSGYVTAYGTGLTHGVASEPCNFTIYTKGAGAGGLAVAVEGPSKVEINCHDNKDGTVGVSYIPAAPGEYKVTVKFADKHIKGSPFTARITGEGRKRNQISVGHSSEVSLKVQEKDVKSLNASIVAPSGLEEPCFVKKLPNGHLGISFTPRESGKHEVNVKRLGKHINGSPFPINVLENEIADASNVRVSGTALQEGISHKDNEILIDTKEAGLGGLSFSVEGPSKADIHCKDNEDGTLKVSYHPLEPGYYIINIKFADHHVKGSPFTVKVTGERSNIQREYIKKQRDAVPVIDVGSECKLTVKLPGTTAFDMTAKVTSPSGVTDDAEILDMEDSVYAVHFKPKEVGIHIVSVRYKDIHIPGSPFQFTVGPLQDFGAHRVHAGGIGLERGITGDPCEFNVWTREAGAGSLAVSVEGPSKAEINFTDRKDGSCYISYKVQEPGDYRVGIKFNDQPIPDSPFSVYILPQSGDTKKIEIGEVTEANLQVNKPVAFTIQMNGAKGMLDGKVVAPSGSEDDCFVAPIDEDQWALRFVPKENGIHQVHIRHNEMHIPQSPFRIRIGPDDADPAAVHADGSGLKECKTGTKTDFIVDSCSAGAGTLAVTIDGPSKVAMDCTEVEEGYKVRYTPLAPGDYYVIIKYNDYHIVGSPFKVHCTGSAVADQGGHETSSVVVETVSKQARQKAENIPKFHSNALKVNSKGMGLKKAYLNKQNTFTVNCGDAGNNLLYVALHGPKGPCEEVYIKHLGRNMYQINYVVKERGDYILFIKYGDDHIPGSPFKVESS